MWLKNQTQEHNQIELSFAVYVVMWRKSQKQDWQLGNMVSDSPDMNKAIIDEVPGIIFDTLELLKHLLQKILK